MRVSKITVVDSPERWLSGRKHRFAKAAWGSNPTAGSNPALSAQVDGVFSSALPSKHFRGLLRLTQPTVSLLGQSGGGHTVAGFTALGLVSPRAPRFQAGSARR